MSRPSLLFLAILVVAVKCKEETEARSCPPALPVDVCDAQCGTGKPCTVEKQMCCPTACGGAMCVDSVSKRHFVDLVKKGRCPEYPRGPWICTHSCTGDSDCPRTLKCCANRCGALTCQKPEKEIQPDAENVDNAENIIPNDVLGE